MPEEGRIRYEVVEEDGTGLPLLHIYLPEDLTSSDVSVTTGQDPNRAEVFVEHAETEELLCFVELSGYHIPRDESQTKYNKKRNRLTLKLVRNVKPAITSPAPFAPAAAAPASTGNSFGLLDNDDVSDGGDDDGGDATPGAKKKKKKKKGKKGGAAANGEEQVEERGLEGAEAGPAANGGSSHIEGSSEVGAGGTGSGAVEQEASQAVLPAAAGGEGGSGAAKKKKKKKKKGGAGAAGGSIVEGQGEAADEGGLDEEIGGNDAEVEAEEAALPERGPSPPAATPLGDVSPSRSASASALASGGVSVSLCKCASRALSVDIAEDFAAEPFGSFEVGRAVDHEPLLGPAVHHGLGKVSVKGEDKWLEAPSNSFVWGSLEDAATPVSAFGIFDGHGGRMAAQHAAKNLLPLVGSFAGRAVGPDVPQDVAALVEAGYLASEEQGRDEATLSRAQTAAVQDALIARLPKAMHAGFVKCDEEVISRHKTSGTTATLAVQVGWELLVANVGDSLAYLDTGSEIVVISANHRVAESTDEQQRIISAGGRIKPAKYGEEEEGPPGTDTPHEGVQLRVWPGGINMTRTIGDEAAKRLLIAEPAVRQISLPVTGARLIIASDGLWDAVNAKATIGQLRTCHAREAASKAAVYAMRNKRHDDDVTVVVADFVPRAIDTHVPGLLKKASGPAAVAAAALAAAGMKEERAAQAWRPLETPSASWRDRHRAHRQRAAAYLEQLAEAEAAEAEAEEQLERQRRMAVAPAAGTAGVGTAIRLPPVSDTYRELAELKLSSADIQAAFEPSDNNAAAEVEGGAVDGDGDEWTQVDTKKKKDVGGFDLRRELIKAARPGEVRAPGGGAGREPRGERRGRERPPRRERDAESGGGSAAVTDAGVGVVENAAEQAQAPPAGPQRERRERRDRAGRDGGSGGSTSAGLPEATGGGTLAATPPAPASGTTAATPPGVVKAEGYLYVPKSLLTGGHAPAAAAAPAAMAAAAEVSRDAGKPRRERPPRRPRREGPPPPARAAPPAESPDGAEYGIGVAGGAPTDGSASAAPLTNSRRVQQRRNKKEKDAVAAAAAAAAMGGLPSAAATPQPHAPAATSSRDPVVELSAAPGHRRQQHPPPQHRNQQHSYASQPTAPTQGSQQQAAHEPGQQQYPPQGGDRTAASPHYPKQQAPQSHQNSQEAPQQQHSRPAGAPPAAPPVPTYAAPLDFGAGFGPGSGMWQAPTGGQYGGPQTAPAAPGAPGVGAAAGTGTTVHLPQRPPGLAPTGNIRGPRNPHDVAAAAAAAAAAAVARKAAAGRGGGGVGRGVGGQYAGGRA